jgi:hypothetical protein
MKKIDLGQTIGIVANIGVIVGIVFLTLEIRQNNLLMRSQTRSQISQSISDMLLRSVNSDYFAELVDPEELEEQGESAVRFRVFQMANFRIWENVYYQWRNGLYEDSEYEAEKQIWETNVNLPSIRRVYCGFHSALSAGFEAEMNALLDKPC